MVVYNIKETREYIVENISVHPAFMDDFKKYLIRNGIAVGVIIVVFITFFVLFRLNIDRQLEVITHLKSQKAVVAQSAENLAILIKDWEIVKQWKDQVRKLVPQKDALVLLSKNFQDIAKLRSVSLNFSFGGETNPASQDSLGSVSFTAVAEGKRENLLQFFEDLENKYYSLKIRVLDITSQGTFDRAFFTGDVFFVGN